MGKRTTKADLILSAAHDRVQLAEFEVRSAHQALQTAQAVLTAHRDSYNALEKSLAPKPRGRSAPAPTVEKKKKTRTAQPTLVPDAKVESEQGDLCVHCNQDENYQDHFAPSPNFHEFEGKKAASAA